MKKFLVAMGVAAFAFVGCGDDSSSSSGPDDDSSSSEKAVSSSSKIAETSSSFNPDEYRTCDKKYEGKFLLYQYRETLDAWYGTYRVNTVFYKCKNGKWSGPSATSPENLTEGDVIRAAPDDWECDAENEGQVQSWRFMVFAVPHSPMGYTPTYYARCEQGDWVLCEPESSSSSSEKSKSSSSKNEESSSSVKSSSSSSVILSASEESSSSVVESSSSVAESSSSEVTPQSSSSSADVQSSSSEPESSSSSSEDKVNCSALLEGETGWSWDVPKECRFNPDIDYGSMTDEGDGKTYKTVKIFDQWWMTEDLKFNPGDTSVSCYTITDTSCENKGGWYTWEFLMDAEGAYSDDAVGCFDTTMCKPTSRVRGICPEGWRVPNLKDWVHLVVNLGGFLDLANTSGIANKNRNILFNYPFHKEPKKI